jgi:hypothetical protein
MRTIDYTIYIPHCSWSENEAEMLSWQRQYKALQAAEVERFAAAHRHDVVEKIVWRDENRYDVEIEQEVDFNCTLSLTYNED